MSIPLRTCIGCHKTTFKSELIRIVRLDNGNIVPDLNCKEKGRGAYVCPNLDCISKALKLDKLNKAFRIKPNSVNQLNLDIVNMAIKHLLEVLKQ
ncbi:MAG: YlxR family protein [Candidatus Poribacteria bacterium]